MMEYNSAIKKNKLLLSATRIALGSFKLSKSR
jgi:hypothetical protein